MSDTTTIKKSATDTKTAAGSKFAYVIYIRTTQDKLWDALTKPEFTKQFWCGTEQKSDFKTGSPWSIVTPDGRIIDSGEILEVDRPHKLVLKWQHQLKPELKVEGCSQAILELEPAGETVKLTVTHTMGTSGSKFIEMVSTGWPLILSSLKSLLETGQSFEQTRQLPEGF